MTLSYTPAIKKGDKHIILIETDKLETTKAKEVLKFAEKRVFSKSVWKLLKEAVRLGEPLEIKGGGLF